MPPGPRLRPQTTHSFAAHRLPRHDAASFDAWPASSTVPAAPGRGWAYQLEWAVVGLTYPEPLGSTGRFSSSSTRDAAALASTSSLCRAVIGLKLSADATNMISAVMNCSGR